MAVPSETPQDTLVTFLPHRLNRQPVVVRGLTADELWICAGLSAAAGFALGLPRAWLTHSIAMVPTLIVAGIALGVFVGGGFLRAQKRGPWWASTDPTSSTPISPCSMHFSRTWDLPCAFRKAWTRWE